MDFICKRRKFARRKHKFFTLLMARRRALDAQGAAAMADGPVDEEQQEAGMLHACNLTTQR